MLADFNIVGDYKNLGVLRGESVIIVCSDSQGCIIKIDNGISETIKSVRNTSMLYHRIHNSETIIFDSLEVRLRSIPYSDSYFCIQTFKSLDDALQRYKTEIALHSTACPYLKDVWISANKIFFLPAPEHKMRDSLRYFLSLSIRSANVRAEQNVDESHPVDIKVNWNYSSDVAIIEIKWLGKSYSEIDDKVTQTYTQVRALRGAQQLNDYLDAHMIRSPEEPTIGYLVIFDGRRSRAKPSDTTISLQKGMYYRNKEIDYNPEFYNIRKDFRKPLRFFMEPKIS